MHGLRFVIADINVIWPFNYHRDIFIEFAECFDDCQGDEVLDEYDCGAVGVVVEE